VLPRSIAPSLKAAPLTPLNWTTNHRHGKIGSKESIPMKNIQVIDGAMNSEYAIFRISDELFQLIFPQEGQDIEFVEDVIRRVGRGKINILSEICPESRIKKTEAQGIHGTLFYELIKQKKRYYPNKKETDLNENWVIRRLIIKREKAEALKLKRKVLRAKGSSSK
jgi:hypothetical protein